MTESTEPTVASPRRQARRRGVHRTIVHKVKVSPEQEVRLQARADERGVTVSRLMVEAALAGDADAAAWRASWAVELFQIQQMLGKVGVNINQIARATNATGEVQGGTVGALDAMARVCGRLEAFVDVAGR